MITRRDGDRKQDRRSTGGRPARLDSITTRAAQGQDLNRGPLLTVAQASEYLGTGERFIRRLITERRIAYVKVGKYVRLERATLDAFVDAGRVHSQR
jgi:excisionase family DNA binding protein